MRQLKLLLGLSLVLILLSFFNFDARVFNLYDTYFVIGVAGVFKSIGFILLGVALFKLWRIK
ncbi:hypothetical protein [Roseivirga sp.]|uniref:hypothetical protein n=1 Tax=Roseivirga sp. TaxID=1964215 RepID=UPI003B51A664